MAFRTIVRRSGMYDGFMGDARMAMPAQHDADRADGSNLDCASGQEPPFAAQLRKTLNTIPAFTWYALPSGTLTFVNEGYADYLGLAKDDPLRLGVEIPIPWDTHIQLVHPDDHEETLRVGETCNRTGTAGQAAFRIRNSEGKYRWFLSRLEPLRAQDGTLMYWIGINLDIEELKQAEEQRRIAEEKIREQEVELRHILDLTPQLIAVFGPRREHLYLNRIALDYLGVGLSEWRDRQSGTEVHPDDLEMQRLHWDRAMSSGCAFEIEVRMRKSDGIFRWFLARYNPVRDDGGQVLRWYVAFTDIQDRKRDEEKLQQENAATQRQAEEERARAERLELRVRSLVEELDSKSGYRRVLGQSKEWKAVLKQAAQVAATDTTVLLTGESGTGKEVVARFIHRASARKDAPLLAVNCAALPEQLLESELFGYERGAFTSALQSKPGQIELAAGGVLFLDEVSEMVPSAQAKLLRVIQEREFRRVGGTRILKADIRIVAATNRNLKQAMERGDFRQDLFYRLSVFNISLPPLRSRPDDLMPLAEAFLDEFAKSFGCPPAGLTRRAKDALLAYHWPGNVRELRNVLERAAILSEGALIDIEHLALDISPDVSAPNVAPTDLNAMERETICRVMRECKGNKSLAAKRLGLSRTQLYVRLTKYGIAATTT
jgi:PAS domain S-box-containing protein